MSDDNNYCAELSNARINRFSDGFFPSTSHLWNSLYLLFFQFPSIFLPLKRKSITTTGTRWHNFFFYIYILLFSFIVILSFFFFVTCHYLPLPFLRGADVKKGTMCLFCVPIHRKEKKITTTIMKVSMDFISEYSPYFTYAAPAL